MGGGLNLRPATEVRRRPAEDGSVDPAIGAGASDGGQQGGTPELNPCESVRSAAFVAGPGVDPAVGTPVALAGPDQPIVVATATGVDLGALQGVDAKQVSNCMKLGYRFAGVVTTWNPATREGTVEIGGV